MTEAELTGIEKAARRMLGASCDETLALVTEVRRLREALADSENHFEETAAIMHQNDRLREALEEITRLGRGHSLDSALVVARAALRAARG